MILSRLVFFAVLFCSFAGLATAQNIRLSDRFDPSRLDRTEKRILQAALALDRNYEALLDGAWGRGSQSALEARVRAGGGGTPTWRDVRSILRAFEAERAGNGWAPVWHADHGVWHVRPDGLLDRQDVADETRFVSPEGGLVMLARTARTRPSALHDDFALDAAPGSDPYRLDADDRLVTAARMRGGRYAYVRSDRSSRGWITHILIADDANRGRMQLIASSFATRREADLAPEGTRVVSALLGTADRAPLPQTPSRASDPIRSDDPLEAVLGLVLDRALDRLLDDDDEDRATAPVADPVRPQDDWTRRDVYLATGVRVNTTDILTAADPDVCRDGFRLADGGDLDILLRDGATDLTVLASRGRARDWVGLAEDDVIRGDVIRVLSRDARSAGLRSDRARVARGRADRGGLALDGDLGGVTVGAALLRGDGRLRGLRGRDGRVVSSTDIADMLDAEGIPWVSHRVDEADLDTRERGAVVALRCR